MTDSGYFCCRCCRGYFYCFKARHDACRRDEKTLKKDGENILNVDIIDWTIVDMGDILVHLMSSEYRTRYNLEEFLKEFEAKKEDRARGFTPLFAFSLAVMPKQPSAVFILRATTAKIFKYTSSLSEPKILFSV